jgi:mannan endo-1,4-beta-mannosidase
MLFLQMLHCLLAAGTVVLAAPSTNPVNGKSTAATKNLLSYLVRQSANGNTLSGQQDLESAQWVAQNIGKSPAVLGVDFMDYSPSRVAYGSSAHTVEDAISYANAGGIITFCWHWGKFIPWQPAVSRLTSIADPF